MFKEKIKVRLNFKAELFGPDGKLKEYRRKDNMVVTAGLTLIADLVSAQTKALPSHAAIGTGTTAPTAGDTALENELDRNALTSATSSNNVATYVADWAAGDGTGSITEAGLFNASSGGDMLSRVTFAVVNKGASDTLKCTWSHTYTYAA